MLNCRQVTQLISRSLDTRLSWPQRLAVRFHLLYCVWCRRYAAQVRFLRKAAGTLTEITGQRETPRLSSEAKQHIQQRLQQALREQTPPR